MKNKKGFTLIELLAVIVILAIIALIAVPIVLKIISNSKESSAMRSAEIYIEAIETTVVSKQLSKETLVAGTYEIKEGNLYQEDKLKYEIKMKGTKPTGESITINEKGKVESAKIIIDSYLLYYANGKIKSLPNEYQQVEYIESTGTQYIDTEIIPSNLTGIYIRGMFLSNTSTAIAGCMDTTITNCRYNLPYKGQDSSYSYWSWNTVNQSNNFINENIILELKFNYLNDRKVTLDNFLIFSNLPTLKVGNRSLFLFDINRNGVPYYKGKSRIYNVKISNDNELVRYMIPCYRKSDYEIGMYDVINNKFYINSGTGIFLKGNDA